ncbi:hypothetical protein [Streptomyces sp. NPDC002889]|uniref:hypothetical protein n=1 Tax=Streptomyces sp. NPDC002889 TaxID=3364669 RepID=UPI00368415E2
MAVHFSRQEILVRALHRPCGISATTDNRTLDERLKAARSNLRFQDRRVADLEARIADPGTAT